MQIKSDSGNPVVDISLDTISKDKQALVFCSSKRGAEKQAEDISKKIKEKNPELEKIAEKFEKALPNPTKQCLRDAKCIRKGIAFHHAGLVTKQRELIENNFRNGKIKIICSTPTLAAGMDMPAFRTILKDLKRYSGRWGMQYIPVLEYEQMAGRAGRPGKEDFGEAIAIAAHDAEAEKIKEQYIFGAVENIQSKLAVEPVLRTYVLSLATTGFVKTRQELVEFFEKTFYARQFGDMDKLEEILDKVIGQLKLWGFLERSETEVMFTTEGEESSEEIKVTPIGRRVSELYLDPYTAKDLIEGMRKFHEKQIDDYEISLLHLIVNTLEMEPLLMVKQADRESLNLALLKWEKQILSEIPQEFDFDFEDFLRTIKTTLFFRAWVGETDEEEILEKFNTRPGETRAKIENADWLIRCCIELCKFMEIKDLISKFYRLQTRIKYGVKEELLALLKIKGVGRVRARKLFDSGYKDLGNFDEKKSEDVKKIVGEALTKSIYDQLGKKIKSNDLTDFI